MDRPVGWEPSGIAEGVQPFRFERTDEELRVGAVGDYQPFNLVGEGGERYGLDRTSPWLSTNGWGAVQFVRREWERLFSALLGDGHGGV